MWEYPLDAWLKVLAVDLDSVFHCCRAAVPSMRTRGYGRIVNIASIAGKEGAEAFGQIQANRKHLARDDAQDAGRSTVRAGHRDETHVGIVSGTGPTPLEAALKRQQIDRPVMLELPTFLGLPAILSTTDLIATLPNLIGEMLARESGLPMFPCQFEDPSFTVKQHWHERYHHDSNWLREVCAVLYMAEGARNGVKHSHSPKQY